MEKISTLIHELHSGNNRALARCITIVENELEGSEEILKQLKPSKTPAIIGVTGPPGAGKSTLINSLISFLSKQNLRIGVIAIDPTSPFNYGSLLGDRVRMSEHFTDENVFIRSLATRGSLGGLSSKTIEITDVMKCAGFDYIIVETVGVGQSEVEIVGLADTTVLVLVPESGDEVQSLKSGIMEIADIFVVNKSDRPGASGFLKNLHQLVHQHNPEKWTPKIVRAVATKNEGVEELFKNIQLHLAQRTTKNRALLYAEKAYQIIQSRRMKSVSKKILTEKISEYFIKGDFNLYRFVEEIESSKK